MDHLIHRQILDLNVPKRVGAARIQDQIRDLYWVQIAPALEQLFSQAVPEDVVVRLDKLEVDLGDVTVEKFTARVLEKIQEQVKDILSRNGLENGWNAEGKPLQKRPFEEGVEILSAVRSEFEALTTFLETGHFPWWAPPGNRVSPAKLLVRLLERDPQRLIRSLQATVTPRTAKRLQEQFPLPLLLQLWAAASTDRKVTADIVRQLQREWEVLMAEIPGSAAPLPVSLHPERGKLALSQSIRMQIAKAIVSPAAAEWPADPATLTGRLLESTFQTLSLPQQEGINGLAALIAKTKKRPALISAFLRRKRKRSETSEITAKQPVKPGSKPGVLSPKKKSSYAAPGSDTQPPASAPEQESERRQVSGRLQEALESGLFIRNAGLVLLVPFLPPFFKQLGLVVGNAFPGERERERAVLLTQYLVTGQTELPEEELLLNKLVCAWPLEEPLVAHIVLTDEEMRESEDLLQSVSKHWTALGKTSNEALRETFLRREGKLLSRETGYKLLVERKGVDVLLERLPWSIGYIKLPWMAYAIQVEW